MPHKLAPHGLTFSNGVHVTEKNNKQTFFSFTYLIIMILFCHSNCTDMNEVLSRSDKTVPVGDNYHLFLRGVVSHLFIVMPPTRANKRSRRKLLCYRHTCWLCRDHAIIDIKTSSSKKKKDYSLKRYIQLFIIIINNRF